MEVEVYVLRSAAIALMALLFCFQHMYYPMSTIYMTIGEFFHSVSYILLVELFWMNKGLKGLSVKTQILFYLVHWTRYFDAFIYPHSSKSILILKLWYMAVSVIVLICIYKMRETYETSKDTASLYLLVLISIIIGIINYLCASSKTNYDCVWIISHYLQGFAMVPQFIFCYRDSENDDPLLFLYILSLGGYRLLYAFNWLHRFHNEKFFYVSGPLGLIILLVFLGDFLLFKIRKESFLSAWVLKVDDTVEELQHPLLNALYSMNYEQLSSSQGITASNPFSHSARVLARNNIQPSTHVAGEGRGEYVSPTPAPIEMTDGPLAHHAITTRQPQYAENHKQDDETASQVSSSEDEGNV